MRILCLCLFILSLSFLHLNGQQVPKKAEKLYKSAESSFLTQQSVLAMESLEKAIKIYPEYVDAWKLKSQILLKQEKFDEAQTVFLKLIEIDPKLSWRVYYQMGLIDLDRGKLVEALSAFEKASNQGNLTEKQSERINGQIEICKNRINLMADKKPFNPIPLTDNLNSEFDEYLPIFTADGSRIFFTRKMLVTELPNEDFYWAEKNDSGDWDIAQNFGLPVNTPLGQQGAMSISPDGNRMFYAQKDPQKNGGFDIYYSYVINGEWTLPINLGLPISTQHWESQPCISADSKSLFFASKRPGGKGGIDIWKSELIDNRWQEPINMEGINTAGDEQCPFLHADGKTLYFSSNGHPGMGDADIFMATMNSDGNWEGIENLGYPINTFANENSLMVDRNGKTAYYSSYVEGKGFDLFQFELPEESRAEYVTYVKGIVKDDESKDFLNAKIEIVDLETGEIMNTLNSQENDGSFLVILPANKKYAFNASKENYILYSDHFEPDLVKEEEPYLLDIFLEKIVMADSFILENIFFETGKSELLESSKYELNKILELLQTDSNLKVEIIGHTDNVGDEALNLNLSKKRARSVYDYLASKGIATQRLKSDGKGESEPISDNETEQGRQQNRRTEFKILR